MEGSPRSNAVIIAAISVRSRLASASLSGSPTAAVTSKPPNRIASPVFFMSLSFPHLRSETGRDAAHPHTAGKSSAGHLIGVGLAGPEEGPGYQPLTLTPCEAVESVPRRRSRAEGRTCVQPTDRLHALDAPRLRAVARRRASLRRAVPRKRGGLDVARRAARRCGRDLLRHPHVPDVRVLLDGGPLRSNARRATRDDRVRQRSVEASRRAVVAQAAA